jgi:ketosteroid isomerase-like protein
VQQFLECPFDSDRREKLWAEEGIFEIPYSTRGRIIIKGRDKIALRMRSLAEVMDAPLFTNSKIYPTLDPEVFFTTSTFRATIRSTGQLYEDEYVQIFYVRNDKIYRRVEYFNPLAMQHALGAQRLALPGD